MQPSRKPDIDRLLTEALKQYGKEPRPGLEARVLVTIREHRKNAERDWRWKTVLAAVGTLAVLIAFIPTRKAHFPVTTQMAVNPSPVAQASKKLSIPLSKLPKVGLSAESGRTDHERRTISAPHLAQFPSPSPLSEQERLLLQYIHHEPSRAVLLAKAQTELFKQNELEEQRSLNDESPLTEQQDNKSGDQQ